MLRAGSPYGGSETDGGGAFNQLVKMALSKQTPEPPSDVSDSLREVISACLRWDRRARPSARDLLEYSFFQ